MISLSSNPSKQDVPKSQSKRPYRSKTNSKKARNNSLAITARGRTKHLNEAIPNGTYIAFDIETTGGNPERNGITEIFALRYKSGRVIDTFSSMVNPKVPIPPIVRRMTGITNKMVKDAPLIEEVMPGFVEFIKDDVLVSHNTIGDMKFIRYFSEKVTGRMVSNYYLCTHLLVEKLVQEAPDKSLKGLAEFFNLPADQKLHRAKADAYLTLELFKCLQKKMLEKGVDKVIDGIRFQGDYESGMRLGWGIEPEVIKNLPETTGVFYLYDYLGNLTFLSSASNIAKEVRKLQRFSSLPKQLLKSVLASTDVRYAETTTSFAAAMAEAEGVKEHRLRFDPANWHQRTANFLFIKSEDEGFRVATGPLSHDVFFALGPIRGGREVSILLENLAQTFEKKVTKKGLRLSDKEGKVLVDFLQGAPKKMTLLDSLIHLLPRFFSSERIKELQTKLKSIGLPKELHKLESCSGVVAVPRDDAWHVYTVVAGLPQDEIIIHGDLVQELHKNRLNIKLYKKIKRGIHSVRQKKRSIIPFGNAVIMNRMFWWAYFGNRHENIRVFHVEDLTDL